MNLSVNWLNDYVNTRSVPIAELASRLTMSGSKVEKYASLSEPLEKIVIGKVLEVKKHENSDRLWICKVDARASEPVQIVTGARNVFAGAFVPVVLDGGTVLNRQDGSAVKIKKGKLRGEVSDGMLCSLDELGLDKSEFPYADADGILVLNGDPEFDKAEIGMDALEFFGLNDAVMEFEITNNRPDCLSVTGLAREAAAVFNLPLDIKEPAYKGFKCDIEKEIDVIIENKRLCSRYMAGLAKNVKIAPSPKWLASRLKASGIRPINNIVDITNYVMLEYGYPLHAFDRRFVEGGQIIIRSALPGERITLLDGNTASLDNSVLVIADRMKPIAVAGVMGGEYSGVVPDTGTVIFEAACFDGVSVRMASKKIGRRTESSSRFEKGLDPANVKTALLRALQLTEELGCGEVSDTFVDYVNFEETRRKIPHDYKEINGILGTDISESEQTGIFKRLGFGREGGAVVPPGFRSDVELTCDLAEEVARIYGYDNIESTLPRLGKSGVISEYEKNVRFLVNALTASGCYECVTYGFASPKTNERFSADCGVGVKIRNPFGEETGEMRTSLIPSMLNVIANNINARNPGARFFEIGKTYSKDGEKEVLCVGLYGKDESFYTLKGVIEEIADLRKIEAAAEPPFHPGRAARGDTVRFGEISPLVLEEFGISERVYMAEADLEGLFGGFNPQKYYKPIPRYPAVTRDLSLVCPDGAVSGDIVAVIEKNGDFLESVEFFDVFKGGNLKEGEKSLSYKLVFRKSGGTLTDAEVDGAISKILSALEKDDIKLRG
ncbi:MAG: phenylalanine--tRNA ligase subunit beta [Oscillospiraceae bacterium]|jgi:phenylalanyl-tRNA synthetase beta chain|nr:phenylalanine--tRNA ligase subunit beta [Oscillospiraceae bacterium]